MRRLLVLVAALIAALSSVEVFALAPHEMCPAGTTYMGHRVEDGILIITCAGGGGGGGGPYYRGESVIVTPPAGPPGPINLPGIGTPGLPGTTIWPGTEPGNGSGGVANPAEPPAEPPVPPDDTDASRDATGTTQIKLGTELGGTQVLSSALSLTSSAYAWYSGAAQTTKPGGGAWTRQDLANMKLVAEMVANAIGRTARVDVLKAVVNYTPVSGYEPGVTIGLASDNKVKVVAMQAETDTYVTALSSATLTANQWNLVAVTMSPGGDFGKNQACISVNGGTLSCTALGYVIRQPASSDLVIAAKSDGTSALNGYLDGLLFAVRPWSQSDVSAYYNSGTGRAFPFY